MPHKNRPSCQHCPEEEPLRKPGDGRELGQALQAGGTASRDGIGGRCKHCQGRQVHDVVGVAERDFRKRIGEVHYRPGPVADREAGDPENEAEHDDLQHVAPRQGVHDARRDGVLEGFDETGRFREFHAGGRIQRQAVARPGQHHAEPAEQQSDGGGDFEADHRLPAQPPQRAHGPGAGDRPDQHAPPAPGR